MTIKAGDRIPSATLWRVGKDGVDKVDAVKYLEKKRVVIIGVPGAFTSVCSQKHLPAYIQNSHKIKGKGADEIVCVAVNDPAVLRAWGESLHIDDRISLLSDGNGDFTKAMGLELDLRAKGLGIRSQRYSMIVDDGLVETLNVEPVAGEVTLSGADVCMGVL